MKVTRIGLDIAKNVFQVHGVDEHGKVVFRKTRKRDQVTEFFANLPPCLIGIETCGSAHHRARTLAWEHEISITKLSVFGVTDWRSSA